MTVQPAMPGRSLRGEALWFVAEMFARAPGPDMLRTMLQVAGTGGADGSDPVARLVAAVAAAGDLEGLSQQLAVEHARLFGGLGEGYGPPPPYESLWREGVLMGETTVSVGTAYLAAGYRPSGEWLPHDHLVEELHFLASLCHAEDQADATARDADAAWARDAQEAFVSHHLAAWVPAYCLALGEAAREPFFQALADLTANLIGQARAQADHGIAADSTQRR